MKVTISYSNIQYKSMICCCIYLYITGYCFWKKSLMLTKEKNSKTVILQLTIFYLNVF